MKVLTSGAVLTISTLEMVVVGGGVAYYILEILSCFLSVVKPAPEASKCIRWVHRNNNMNSGNNTLNLPAVLF